MQEEPLLQGRRLPRPNLESATEIALADVPEFIGVRIFHLRIILFGCCALAVPASIISSVPFVLQEIMEEFKVVKAQVVLVGSCVLFGSILGTIVIGSLCDRFGRKFMLACCFVLTGSLALSHLAIPTGPSGFTLLLVVRSLLGLCFGGASIATLPYVVEFISDSWRGTVGGVVQLGWAFGSVSTIFIAKGFQGNWRIVCAFPVCTSMLCLGLLFLCPESPRWLFVAGYEDDGYIVIRSIMSSAILTGPDHQRRDVPRISCPLSAMDSPRHSRALSEQLLGLLSPSVRRTTICACLLFILTAGSSYAIFMWLPMILKDIANAEEFEYELFIWSDVAGFLGGCAATLVLDSLGRKWSYISGAFVSGLCKASFPLVASRSSTLVGIYAIVILNSFFVTIAWSAMMVFIAEAFPTSLRGTGGGAAGFCGRLSAATTPILIGMLIEVNVQWAFAVASCLILSGALVALLTTEMAHAQMSDDVEQRKE